jgi:protein-tyrosine phosphatase
MYKTRILMVCLGNICRSPLAEGILRHRIQQAGLEHKVEIDSAGTSNYHIGEPPDKRTQKNALQHGVDLSKLRGRQFTIEDTSYFDRIYAMDTMNLKTIHQLIGNHKHSATIDLLLNHNWPGENRAVPDPYYGDEQDFEQVFQLVDQACAKIVEQLKIEHQ